MLQPHVLYRVVGCVAKGSGVALDLQRMESFYLGAQAGFSVLTAFLSRKRGRRPLSGRHICHSVGISTNIISGDNSRQIRSVLIFDRDKTLGKEACEKVFGGL